MKQKSLLKTLFLLLFALVAGSGSAWGQVASAVPENGKSYVVAAYVDNKYYAFPNKTSDGSIITGEEISLNYVGKVSTSDAIDITWTLEEGTGGNAGMFYLKYTSGNSTYYLYKNGTTTTNYNFKISTGYKNYWSFTTNGTGYTVAAIDRGTEHVNIQCNHGTFRCSYSATPIILLEIGDVTAATVSVPVTSAGLATFACDNDLDYSNVDGLEAYIATNNNNNNEVILQQVNVVPAGTGVLLRATDGGGKSYEVSTTTVTETDRATISGNLFVRGTGAAVASEVTVNDGATKYYNYILNIVDNKLGFYRAAGKMVDTNRAYLQTSVAAEARVDINFGENSGIVTVSREATASNRYYDLQGRSVMQPTKGLYIVNGKKVVVK